MWTTIPALLLLILLPHCHAVAQADGGHNSEQSVNNTDNQACTNYPPDPRPVVVFNLTECITDPTVSVTGTASSCTNNRHMEVHYWHSAAERHNQTVTSSECLPCGIHGVPQIFQPGKPWSCMHRFVEPCLFNAVALKADWHWFHNLTAEATDKVEYKQLQAAEKPIFKDFMTLRLTWGNLNRKLGGRIGGPAASTNVKQRDMKCFYYWACLATLLCLISPTIAAFNVAMRYSRRHRDRIGEFDGVAGGGGSSEHSGKKRSHSR